MTYDSELLDEKQKSRVLDRFCKQVLTRCLLQPGREPRDVFKYIYAPPKKLEITHTEVFTFNELN